MKDTLINHKNATLLGASALLLWTVEPLLVVEMGDFPLFQSLSLMFFASFLVTAFRLTKNKRWKLAFKQPLFLWFLGTICICGSDFAYILGSHCAPIAHVDLIDYLWPCFVIIFASMLPSEKFYGHQIVGACVGMLGVLVLLTGGNSIDKFNTDFSLGYLLAFKSALMWGAYAAISRHYKDAPTEMVGLYCGVASVICLVMHLSFEQTVVPKASELIATIALGVTAAGIAYQLWDYGVKFGNYKLLGALTYVARILAMVLLVLIGQEPFSWALVVAVILACFGIFLATASRTRLYTFVSKIISVFPNNRYKTIFSTKNKAEAS